MKEKSEQNNFIFLWLLLCLCAIQQIAPVSIDSNIVKHAAIFSYENLSLLIKQTAPFIKNPNDSIFFKNPDSFAAIYNFDTFFSPIKILLLSPLNFINNHTFELFLTSIIFISLPLSLLVISKKLNLLRLSPFFILIACLHPSFSSAQNNFSENLFGFFSFSLAVYYISKPALAGLLILISSLLEPIFIITLPILIIYKQYKTLLWFVISAVAVFFICPILWLDYFKVFISDFYNILSSSLNGFSYVFAMWGIYLFDDGYNLGTSFGFKLFFAAYFTFLTIIYGKKRYTNIKTSNLEQDLVISLLLCIPFIISFPGFSQYEIICASSLMLPLIIIAFKMGFACRLCCFGFSIFYLLAAINIEKLAELIPSIMISTIPSLGACMLCFLSCAFTMRWAKYQNKLKLLDF
ncbi:MAG: hypothetical protein AB7U85_03840 [Alphaproteobacteria bacterium]